MPSKRDHYEILGINKDATDEEIRSAFRRLAFKYHPDHNHEDGAEEKFKEVNEAYQVLSDPDRRATYDRFGHSDSQGLFGRDFEGFDFGGLGNIFDAFFGGRTATAARQAPQRGTDLQHQLTITLEEVAFGADREITISRTERCSQCHGTGCKADCQPRRCPNCNGTGQVKRVQQSIFGRFTNIATCPQCSGEGKIITDPCPRCRGSGEEERERSIVVKIPAGVEDGSRIRLSGEGDAGIRGGPPGNLYVSLSVKQHELFLREGDDILYELPVNFAQAALGAEVPVPTLEGAEKLKVPAGSQTGQVIKLKNKGVPHLHGRGRGDQLVRLLVVTPDSLTKRERELFEELAQTLGQGKKAK